MNSYRSSPLSNIPPVVKNLLIINVIFFIAMQLFSGNGSYPLVRYLAVYYFDSPTFRVWQVITYMFMHSPTSLMHILFNMFALFSFGPVLEYTFGSKRFLNFYLITGLGALVLQMIVQAIEVYGITGSIINPNAVTVDYATNMVSLNIQGLSQEDGQKLMGLYTSPMLGASGAIFGVLIAFGMLFPNAELILLFIPVPVKAKYLIPCYILLELFLGVKQFSGDSVAHFAHLGGALFGFLLIKYWGIRRPGGFI
ncbi:rhomboid family intramembrane serine protease [Pedobacter sp. P351]|uniref:rhomboid family intramembrane serine protease n=1 Tax=Pedobacter superstes TaxID=3133441 RepID=UPI0030B2CA3A